MLSRSTVAFVFLSGVIVAVGAIILSDHLRELRSRRDAQLQQQFLPDVVHMSVVEETSLFSQGTNLMTSFQNVELYGALDGAMKAKAC